MENNEIIDNKEDLCKVYFKGIPLKKFIDELRQNKIHGFRLNEFNKSCIRQFINDKSNSKCESLESYIYSSHYGGSDSSSSGSDSGSDSDSSSSSSSSSDDEKYRNKNIRINIINNSLYNPHITKFIHDNSIYDIYIEDKKREEIRDENSREMKDETRELSNLGAIASSINS